VRPLPLEPLLPSTFHPLDRPVLGERLADAASLSFSRSPAVTVGINRTGSTGFGQKFCDDIKEDWGGAPFRDIVAGMQFVKDAYPEIDAERMAGCGASYGGFMSLFVQGHNDVLGFKALVCHDGVFNTQNTYYTTDELCVCCSLAPPAARPRDGTLTVFDARSYFPQREFGGAPWEVPDNYAKFSPHNFIKHWKTPQLIIRASSSISLSLLLSLSLSVSPSLSLPLSLLLSILPSLTRSYTPADGSKDYRLVEGEGLSAFNTLQRLGVPSRLLIFPSENHVRPLSLLSPSLLSPRTHARPS